MNKTRMYIVFSLLTVLMITACTLEGDIEEVLEKAGVGNNNNSNKLAAPSGVTATAESSSSIIIRWNPVSGTNEYGVWRSSSPSGSYVFRSWTSTDTTYTDTGLSANTTYYYKVVARNSYGESPLSSPSPPATTFSSSSSSNPIDLPYDEYYNNTLYAGEIHNYRFYASSGTYRIYWDDVDNFPAGFSANIQVGVKREGASSYIVDVTNSGNLENQIIFNASISGYFIIEVRGFGSSSSGTYRISYYRIWNGE